MFEKILIITKNNAVVKLNISSDILKDLINIHVVFEDENKKILGEVEEINNDTLNVKFLGEITDNCFIPGVIKKPALNSTIRIASTEELGLIIGKQERSVNMGVSPLYNNFPITVGIDDLFSNHTAIFGNTGSGKTNGICRIIQNVLSTPDIFPYMSNLFIFDSFGEYINAFKDINKINPYLNFKLISTSSKNQNAERLNIPVSILELEDILNLLNARNFSQISIIEETLKLVKILARNDDNALKYKNHILANAINSLMLTNQTSTRIRDQIYEILSETNTNEINLETEVHRIGYTRKFKDCFIIDSEGRFAERSLIAEYLSKFINNEIKLEESTIKVNYNLSDLEKALHFTLYTERYLLNTQIYNDAISLKVELHKLATGSYKIYFEGYNEYIPLCDYVKNLGIIDNKKTQIININLEDVDDRFAKSITKIFARLFSKFTRNLSERATYPIHMILEEAHRYVTDDNDKELLGYDIFERIAKEGRKYGLVLYLITQRPTDINDDVISQCSNFIIFRINHPSDIEYITKMIPNMTDDIVEKQKNLQSGTCVAFGKIFKIPMIVKMTMASPEPESSNCKVYNNWMVKLKSNESTLVNEES